MLVRTACLVAKTPCLFLNKKETNEEMNLRRRIRRFRSKRFLFIYRVITVNIAGMMPYCACRYKNRFDLYRYGGVIS